MHREKPKVSNSARDPVEKRRKFGGSTVKKQESQNDIGVEEVILLRLSRRLALRRALPRRPSHRGHQDIQPRYARELGRRASGRPTLTHFAPASQHATQAETGEIVSRRSHRA